MPFVPVVPVAPVPAGRQVLGLRSRRKGSCGDALRALAFRRAEIGIQLEQNAVSGGDHDSEIFQPFVRYLVGENRVGAASVRDNIDLIVGIHRGYGRVIEANIGEDPCDHKSGPLDRCDSVGKCFIVKGIQRSGAANPLRVRLGGCLLNLL